MTGCAQDDAAPGFTESTDDVAFRSSCWDASCCPAGSNVIQGTTGADRLNGTTAVNCLVGLAGHDLLTTLGAGDTVLGGPGADSLTASTSTDILYGHAGNDSLSGLGGADTLVPGPGVDTVTGSSGSDHIILTSLCEVVSGETINGGTGTDTLTTPWPLADLQAAGLTVTSVEVINEVEQDFGDVECCDTDVCGENGTCGESAGLVTCTCDTGFTGRKCAWETANLVDEFEGLPDPTSWSLDTASGRHFRRATAFEMDVNGWRPGMFLVEIDTLTTELAAGPSTASLTLPMTDTTARELDLMLLGSDSEALFIETKEGPAGVELATGYPTFFAYGSAFTVVGQERDLDGALVSLTAIDEDGTFRAGGHVERVGATATEVNMIKLWRPAPHAMMDVISGATLGIDDVYMVEWSPSQAGGDWPPEEPLDVCWLLDGDCDEENELDCHPCSEPQGPPPPPPATQCTDDVDNDGDDLVDIDGHAPYALDPMCDHSETCDPGIYPYDHPLHTHTREAGKYYTIFGDVVFCTEYKLDWKVRIYDRAVYMRETFDHMTLDDPAYNAFVSQSGVDPVRWFASQCWIMNTPDAARGCRDQGSCGPFESAPHVYPYSNLGHAHDWYSDYLAAMSADYQHGVNSGGNNWIEYPADFVHLLVHAGDLDPGTTLWGGTSQTAAWGAVLNGAQEDAGVQGAMSSSPHETGHLFGCDHCNLETQMFGDIEFWDVMKTTAGNCGQTGNVNRFFNSTCAGYILGGLNARGGPAGGPYFGD